MKRTVAILTLVLGVSAVFAGDSVKEYYEQQKAEIAPTFQPPELGSEVSVKLANGQPRTGILMKLGATDMTLLTDTGSVAYKRTALHETSRAVFFAEDFAHAEAVVKTREFKQQLNMENMAEEQANLHEASLAVSAKVEKSSESESENEDKKSKNSGEINTTTTTTKTRTEVQRLKATITNATTHPDTYTVEWFFLGKAVKTDDKADESPTTIHSTDSKKVTVEARKRTFVDIASDPFVIQKIETNRSSGYSGDARIKESGVENEGWIVRLKYGSEILDQKASSSIFASDEWTSKLR